MKPSTGSTSSWAGIRRLRIQNDFKSKDARTIDASGKTILPGLIDAHVYLTIPRDGRDSASVARHMKENVPEFLTDYLEQGVTTLRSTGEYWPISSLWMETRSRIYRCWKTRTP